MWLAKLTEKGLLRPSFVPPTEIRRLRDYTRLRADLTHDRSRQVQRLEKLLEDALVKLSTVATDIMGVSGRAMIEALIAGQRDAKVLAGLARGRMKTKRAALIEALSGRFDDHHAELARMLLDQIDALTAQIDTLTARIEQLLAAMPEAQPVDPRRDGPTSGHPVGVTADTLAECARLTTVERLDEIAGIGEHNAQVIIAEIGLDMRRFPTPAHLVSWAKLCPRTIQSGPVTRGGRKGNPYLKGVLGDAAAAAAKDEHLPRRTLPAHRQTPRQAQGPGRGRPLHPGHRLEPAQRPHRPLPRPRTRLPHQPHRHRTQDAQPHRPTHRHGLPGHPRTRRLNPNPHRHNITRLRTPRRVLSLAHSPRVFFRSAPRYCRR